MNIDEYQTLTRSTAIYPGAGEGELAYPALGLSGESGEVADIVKKIIRDNEGEITGEVRDKLKKELGDVMWYIAALCSELELDMSEVCQLNLDKLNSRKERNVLQGSGDDR